MQPKILKARATETASIFSRHGDMKHDTVAFLKGTEYIFSEKEMGPMAPSASARPSLDNSGSTLRGCGTRPLPLVTELRPARDRRGDHIRTLLIALGLRHLALIELGGFVRHGLLAG